MDTITQENFHLFLQSCIIKSYSSKQNIFDIVIDSLEEWYDGSAHSLMEIKMKESKKVKGTHFELLCKAYLESLDKYNNVWCLSETPEDILKLLNLKKKDYGIDIICEDMFHNYIAVQCKYRKVSRSSKNIITWKMLSTFYALCLKTGPWSRYIVMTNADYITHMGPKNKKDLSICIGTWKNINTETWLKMAKMSDEVPKTEDSLSSTILDLSKEELRSTRLSFFEKKI